MCLSRCVPAALACLVVSVTVVSCETIPGHPYIAPAYDPITGDPIGIGFGWQFEIERPMHAEGGAELLLTTRIVSTPSGLTREFVLTCYGGPGNGLEWTALTPNDVISQLQEIAEDTYMVLPTDQAELDQLYDDMEDWITTEWITPHAYHAATGR